MNAAALLRRYRIVLLAIAVSAVVHAAVMMGMPARFDAAGEKDEPAYTASLDPLAEKVSTAPAAPAAPASAARRARARPIAPQPLIDPAMGNETFAGPDAAAAAVAPLLEPEVVPDAMPEVLAMATQAAPIAALEPPKFPVDLLPAKVSIEYALTSAFADGRATYNWSRTGDRYTITSEAEAVGFFTLFLEGRIRQESHGTVGASGLRPESFTERKPGTPNEGLEFDWNANKVTFDRNNEKKTEPLEGNTVDWLSMIFQMAHVPPSGEAYDLRVYTQRRLYKFNLKVLGEEDIAIPLGRVRALHLRHVDPEDGQVVDVWLGLDQHYLPVKLRYPVAKNRLMVEQVATRVSSN
jgi:uncharacterized protein DUF3108